MFWKGWLSFTLFFWGLYAVAAFISLGLEWRNYSGEISDLLARHALRLVLMMLFAAVISFVAVCVSAQLRAYEDIGKSDLGK